MCFSWFITRIQNIWMACSSKLYIECNDVQTSICMSPVYNNNTWWMCVFLSTGLMNPPPSEHAHLDKSQTWGCWRTYGKTESPQQDFRNIRAYKWRLSLGLKFGFRWYDGFKAGQRLNASVVYFGKRLKHNCDVMSGRSCLNVGW